MDKVITIKGWRRPYTLKQVFEALIQNPIKDYILILSIDHYNDQTDKEHKDIYNKYKGYFKDSKYFIHNPCLGCTGNTRFCLEYAFDNYDIDWVIHLEDDTVPGFDFINYMEWATTLKIKDMFAVCAISREIKSDKTKKDISLIDDWFDAAGGFLLTKYAHELTQSIGGLKGLHGKAPHRRIYQSYEEYLKSEENDDTWSWDWFYRYVFIDPIIIVPYVNRALNIGDTDGLFNPSKKWHRKNVYDEIWTGNKELFNNIKFNYKLEK